jgi:uncharacterized damage-inducible protein DinB
MIAPDFVRVMADYNAEMNRRLYAAAERLGEARRQGRAGAFWSNLHGTLSHILWADRMWLSRFAGASKPHVDLGSSDRMYEAFAQLSEQRFETDRAIIGWSHSVDASWLHTDLRWFSGVLQREVKAPVSLLVTHFFNHQTHHRGQAHALITQAGEKTGDTDLFLVVPPSRFEELVRT